MKFFLIIVAVVAAIYGLKLILRLLSGRRRDDFLWKKITPVAAQIETGKMPQLAEIQALADDPAARLLLWQVLESNNLQQIFPEKYKNRRAGAAANLCYLLLSKDELGCQPDAVEFWDSVSFPMPDKPEIEAEYFVFKFNMNPPHWLSETGWRAAAIGPYFLETSDYAMKPKLVNLFTPVSEKTLEKHAYAAHEKFLMGR